MAKLTEAYLRNIIKEEITSVLQEGFMDKTLDFFGRKHPMGRTIRDRAREIRNNPNWDSSSLKNIYGKKINQIIASGDNEAVTYADLLKTIEDQFKHQIDSEIEVDASDKARKESDQKRKDLYNSSIRNQNKREADKKRNDKEFYSDLERENEERAFRGTPEYHEQFRQRVGDQYVSITPDKIKTRPDPRYKGN